MKRFSFSLAIAAVLLPGAAGSQQDSRIDWLRQNAVAVRTIDPGDQNFGDLAELETKLSGARIVLLGESRHGDGATLLAKTRLVEFLHREMGFDVLVFESGFYDCMKAHADADTGVRASFRRCAWPLWSARQELNPLVEYLEQSRARGSPLSVVGLDPDFVGQPSRDHFAGDLRAVLGAARVQPDSQVADFLLIADSLYAYLSPRLPRPSQARVSRFAGTAEALAEVMDTVTALRPPEREYWSRVLRNVASHARFRLGPPGTPPTLEAIQARDRQMAENLSWLARRRFPGRRVVVWSATLHAARNLSAITPLQDEPTPWGISLQEMYRAKRVMGDYLREEFGDGVYSIGFTSLEGTTAGGPSGTPLEAPSAGSLEDLLGRTGLEYAFLDLRHPPGVDWKLTARPLGYSEMNADWSRALDGFFFIRTMTPSTRVAP